MKVSELIAKLQTFDGELPVFVTGYEGGIQQLDPDDVRAIEAFTMGTRSYMGDHEEYDPDMHDPDVWEESLNRFPVIYISR